LLSTISPPVAPPFHARPAPAGDPALGQMAERRAAPHANRFRGRVTPAAGAPSHLLEAVADAVQRFDHVEIVVGPLELLRSRLMWLSMVRSSTYTWSS
jgi:hypothetical protein